MPPPTLADSPADLWATQPIAWPTWAVPYVSYIRGAPDRQGNGWGTVLLRSVLNSHTAASASPAPYAAIPTFP